MARLPCKGCGGNQSAQCGRGITTHARKCYTLQGPAAKRCCRAIAAHGMAPGVQAIPLPPHLKPTTVTAISEEPTRGKNAYICHMDSK